MKYVVRSLKYFLRLCIISVVVLAAMYITEMTPLSLDEMLFVLTKTSRGLLLGGAMILASAAYPRLGFKTRSIKYSIEKNRLQIVTAFLSDGFIVKSESSSEICFRYKSPMRRLMAMYEDEIKVTQSNTDITISGLGKVVASVENRILNYAE